MRDPALVIGGGALGLWAAVRNVGPEAAEQREWVHRMANVRDKLPKRLQPKAKAALREIRDAPPRAAALGEIDRFQEDVGAKYPGAVASLRRDPDKLLTFHDVPAEHGKHIRTTNPIESSFATVRLRQRVTESPGARRRELTDGLRAPPGGRGALETAERRRAAAPGAGGGPFTDGEQVGRPDQEATERAAP